MWVICEGDNANYTVRPVVARCLILEARVVSRKHYNHFLGALSATILARVRAPWLWGMLKWGFLWILPNNLFLTEGGVESSWGKKTIDLR
jgi:hypothetical protein